MRAESYHVQSENVSVNTCPKPQRDVVDLGNAPKCEHIQEGE